jgi:hypothetical protein
MIELFQPYQIRSRLVELVEVGTAFDVSHAANGLLDVLDRGRAIGAGLPTRS